MSKGKDNAEISIVKIEQGRIQFCVLGVSPLIMHAMSAKVGRELLLPRGRKTAADKASSLKHNPYEEYRDSVYKAVGDDGDTRCLVRSTAFKSAMASAALDIPGAAKAQIGRLTYVNGDYVEVYGVPRLHMAVVRSADMNKTPDIRTRAILPAWACRVTVTYTRPILRESSVVNLLAAAGVMRGIGDWRPEKGSGSFGQFELVSSDDERFLSVVKSGGRAAQDKALANPECYDGETAELLSWFDSEANRRGFKVVA